MEARERGKTFRPAEEASTATSTAYSDRKNPESGELILDDLLPAGAFKRAAPGLFSRAAIVQFVDF
ncbi:hypothetical protein HC231_10505 [Brenneria izadpanahii]|uniref:Uncharacterized protein n=1 Tax=Brenneria izadpanahii TaxID=2722756 RepID=A0ABX7UUN3_9GAMM|nr:hypothetical protein [Brenneria izadpanahii]QTF08292.1 hypothetical protein HC231_10505 [Brenneria izadpanahii]